MPGHPLLRVDEPQPRRVAGVRQSGQHLRCSKAAAGKGGERAGGNKAREGGDGACLKFQNIHATLYIAAAHRVLVMC